MLLTRSFIQLQKVLQCASTEDVFMCLAISGMHGCDAKGWETLVGQDDCWRWPDSPSRHAERRKNNVSVVLRHTAGMLCAPQISRSLRGEVCSAASTLVGLLCASSMIFNMMGAWGQRGPGWHLLQFAGWGFCWLKRKNPICTGFLCVQKAC